MEVISYKDFGNSIFKKLCELDESLTANNKAVEQFMTGLTNANDKVVKLYGECESLDNIFKNQVIRYYKEVFAIDEEALKRLSNFIMKDKRLKGEGIEIEECFVIYLSFAHHKESKNGLTQHIPTVNAYILNENESFLMRSVELRPGEKDPTQILKDLTYEVAKHWTKGKNPREDEISLIADEIFVISVVEAEEAYKEDIIEYLAEAIDDKSLLRFL